MTDTHLGWQHASQKQKIKESLSALVDGEASDLELCRILAACDKDPELRQCWGRYQVLSQVLSNDRSDMMVDLSGRIRSAIADKPPLNTGAMTESQNDASDSIGWSTLMVKANLLKSNASNLWSGAGRFAIAASVAAAVILGVQYAPIDQSEGPFVSVPESPISPSKQIVYEGLVNKNIVQAASHSPNVSQSDIQLDHQAITLDDNDLEKVRNNKDDIQKRLNRLVLEHIENASYGGYQGILPYARVPGAEQ